MGYEIFLGVANMSGGQAYTANIAVAILAQVGYEIFLGVLSGGQERIAIYTLCG